MIVPTSEQIEAIRAFAEQVAAFLRNYDVAVRQPDGSAAFVRLDLVAEEVLKMAAAYEADEGPSAERPLLLTCPFGDGLKFAFHTQEQVDMLERHLKVAHGRGWISVKERLPSKEQWCLVMFEQSPEIQMDEWLINEGSPGFFYTDDDAFGKVTYWMPLPSAPQQESEANQND